MRYRFKERVLPGILAARPLTAGHEAGWVRALGRRARQASAPPVIRGVGLSRLLSISRAAARAAHLRRPGRAAPATQGSLR